MDKAATSGDTTLRDFFVNCAHAVESKRVFGDPIGGIVRAFQPRCQVTVHGSFRDPSFTRIPTSAFPAN